VFPPVFVSFSVNGVSVQFKPVTAKNRGLKAVAAAIWNRLSLLLFVYLLLHTMESRGATPVVSEPGQSKLLFLADSGDVLDKKNGSEALTEVQLGEIWDQAIHILGGNANVISRWHGDIRYSVISYGSGRKANRERVHQVMDEVGRVADIAVHSLAPKFGSFAGYLQAVQQSADYQLLPCASSEKSCANFVVVITSSEKMRKLANAIPLREVYRRALVDSDKLDSDRAICFFAPFQTASTIRQSLVFVRDDLPDAMIRTCLQEEIFQSFGLFNDYSGSTYFSFNNMVKPKNITRYDRALLRAVYEFAPGTPAFVVVRRLIKNLKADSGTR